MKKLSIIALLIAAFAALSLSGASAADAGQQITVKLQAQNGSGEAGTATIKWVSDNDVMVSVDLAGGGAAMTVPQPAHIHEGTCATLNPKPEFPLTNIVSGKSETTVMTSLSALTSKSYAINVHKSGAEASVYVSCGDILVANMTGGSMAGGTMAGGTMAGGTMAGGTMSGTMPKSGNGDTLFLAGLLAFGALLLTGTGLVMRRNRI